MRKLMDGQGAGRPGVAGKVGELAETIREGSWCEGQGSLMRGLAYGILDPGGERYRLALLHRSECPACRAYVASLRGLAAVLPPVLLPWGLGAGALVRAGAAAHAGAGLGAGAGAGVQAGAGAQSGVGVGGALSAPGAAGVGGAAGGSWLLAGGPVGGKLAVGCLLALGVGAGCVALTDGLDRPRAAAHRHDFAHASRARAYGAPGDLQAGGRPTEGVPGARSHAAATSQPLSTAGLTPAGRAVREFGPERGSAAGEPRSAFSSAGRATARSASSSPHAFAIARSSPGGSTSGGTPTRASGQSAAARSSPEQTGAGASAAEREFGIG